MCNVYLHIGEYANLLISNKGPIRVKERIELFVYAYILFVSLLCLCMQICLCEYKLHAFRCLRRPEEDTGSPGTRVRSLYVMEHGSPLLTVALTS